MITGLVPTEAVVLSVTSFLDSDISSLLATLRLSHSPDTQEES